MDVKPARLHDGWSAGHQSLDGKAKAGRSVVSSRCRRVIVPRRSPISSIGVRDRRLLCEGRKPRLERQCACFDASRKHGYRLGFQVYNAFGTDASISIEDGSVPFSDSNMTTILELI